MIERAARAIEQAEKQEQRTIGGPRYYVPHARAALSAALDPEDEALVERVAKRMILLRSEGDDRLAGLLLNWDREKAFAVARAAITALKAAAGSE